MIKTDKFTYLTNGHFDDRLQERGFFGQSKYILFEHGIETELGGGRVSITLTEDALGDIDPEDRNKPEVQKAMRAAAVAQGERAITIMNLNKRKRSKRTYLKGRSANGHPHRREKKKGFHLAR